MQTSTIVFKSESKDFRVPSGGIVSSSTSSPTTTTTMRPPPPPPPPRIKLLDAKLEEPTSSIPDLAQEDVGFLRTLQKRRQRQRYKTVIELFLNSKAFVCRSDDDVTRHCFFERYDGDVHGGPFFRVLQDLNSINDSDKPLPVNILKQDDQGRKPTPRSRLTPADAFVQLAPKRAAPFAGWGERSRQGGSTATPSGEVQRRGRVQRGRERGQGPGTHRGNDVAFDREH
ncbi:hypothetical protein D910_07446 [Dendroctonus ponderosae]|uniref:Uncharacterized protein n=1 Tax=Dendroctonus ponderosae TaxID=77166 RepID=U4UAK1_DENPD|nr:hypothetical protein D910_07446 [Dendroctonus ponderosae]